MSLFQYHFNKYPDSFGNIADNKTKHTLITTNIVSCIAVKFRFNQAAGARPKKER